MNFTMIWQLAARYVRGKGSANAVPLLSRISMVAIAVCSGAMIVLLSAFNGMGGLTKDSYKAFYPDIRIIPAKGKFFSFSDSKMDSIKHMNGVQYISSTLEDNVFVTGSDSQQRVVTLKGIDKNYFKVNDVRSYIVKGSDSVTNGELPTAITGAIIAQQMNLDVQNVFTRINIFYSNPKVADPTADPLSAIRSLVVKPEGMFAVMEEFDDKYILAPLPAVQNLFVEEGKYSAIEIKTDDKANIEDVKTQLSKIAGGAYNIETRYEQNKTLYKIMNSEKWAMYAILVLVMIIASINMIGALSLLVLQKRKDIAILKAMGTEPVTIRRIFILEGVLWSLIGGITGLVLGLCVCIGQQHFHWVKMSAGFIVDAYPVSIQWPDFPLVLGTIIFVGIVASWYPAMRATRTEDPSLKSA